MPKTFTTIYNPDIYIYIYIYFLCMSTYNASDILFCQHIFFQVLRNQRIISVWFRLGCWSGVQLRGPHFFFGCRPCFLWGQLDVDKLSRGSRLGNWQAKNFGKGFFLGGEWKHNFYIVKAQAFHKQTELWRVETNELRGDVTYFRFLP